MTQPNSAFSHSDACAVFMGICGRVTDLLTEAGKTEHKVDWKNLHYAREGVSQLHAEFAKVSASYSYFHEQLMLLVQEKNNVVFWVRYQKVLLEKQSDEELQKNIGNWQSRGYSYIEREKLAQLASGDLRYNLARTEACLANCNDQLDLLRERLKEMSDFKYEARLLKDVLNFGNVLQEL